MNKVLLVVIVIFLLLISGFIGGRILQALEGELNLCTQKYCFCEEGTTGEIPCNGCTNINPIYFNGVVNVFKECHAQEIVSCNNGERSERIDIKQDTCKIKFYFFKWV